MIIKYIFERKTAFIQNFLDHLYFNYISFKKSDIFKLKLIY